MMEDVLLESPMEQDVEDEKSSPTEPRRSERARKKPERFDFEKYPPRQQRKRRKRNVEDMMGMDVDAGSEPNTKKSKEKSSKTQAQNVADTFTELFFRTIDTMGVKQHRMNSLRRSLRKAIELVLAGMVTATSNGEHLVTASDRSQTYVVQSNPIAEKMHYTCNCGQRFGVGDRVTCKHIFAVIMSSLDSVLKMFFQISTKQSVADVDEICQLAAKIGITESPVAPTKPLAWAKPSHKSLEKPFQAPQDYFSMILHS